MKAEQETQKASKPQSTHCVSYHVFIVFEVKVLFKVRGFFIELGIYPRMKLPPIDLSFGPIIIKLINPRGDLPQQSLFKFFYLLFITLQGIWGRNEENNRSDTLVLIVRSEQQKHKECVDGVFFEGKEGQTFNHRRNPTGRNWETQSRVLFCRAGSNASHYYRWCMLGYFPRSGGE